MQFPEVHGVLLTLGARERFCLGSATSASPFARREVRAWMLPVVSSGPVSIVAVPSHRPLRGSSALLKAAERPALSCRLEDIAPVPFRRLGRAGEAECAVTRDALPECR